MPPRGRRGRPYWRGRGRGSWARSQRSATPRQAASAPTAGRGIPSPSSSAPSSTPSTQRAVVNVSTPRPTTARSRTRGVASTTTGPSRDQQIICAAVEARGIAATVGLAFVNLTTAEAVLCEISDNPTFVKTLHKLHVFDPSEILIAASTSEQQSKLRQLLVANLMPASPVIAIARKYWDESAGLAYVQALSLREDVEATKVAIEGKYYAICCFAAAMQYVEHMLNLSFAMHSMRIKYEPSEDTMMIDVATIQALELIQNSQNPRSSDSLFGVLNATLTKMGARLLRSSILQPLIDSTVIETRHDALQELTSNAETFVAVRRALGSFQDVDRTLTNIVIEDKRSSVHQREQSINNVLAIKHYIRAIPQVHEALSKASSELLINIQNCCSPDALTEVSRLIDETINDDATFQSKPLQLRNQRVYAVRVGASGLLDIARQAYKEANNDAHQLMVDLQRALKMKQLSLLLTASEMYGINLDMKYDTARQSYFVVRTIDLKGRALPEEFINRVVKKNVIECQTLDLMKLNQKVIDAMHEVLNLSDDVVQQLIRNIRINIAPLYRVSDGIAVLDMLAAFGQVTTTQDYCRPEFSSTLSIKNGRHAVGEKICRAKFVPNDFYATDSKRLQIVTGCNMSGKSTYIRTIALATVMSQIGCFVPADSASFNLRTQLFARVSVDDSATSAISTFAAEMRETAFILRNVDAGSLVIIDELGRGTSTRDGLAIAAAVAEALLRAGAMVWFVTHFRDLPLMFAERSGVASMHLRTARPDSDAVAMLYTVAEGPAQEPHYGLTLARAVGLPADAIATATRVAEALERRREEHRTQHEPARQILVARRRKLFRALYEQLVQAKESGLRGAPLREWLRGLQAEFVRRMAGIDKDACQRGNRVSSEDNEVVEVEPPPAAVTSNGRSLQIQMQTRSRASSVTVTGEESSEWRELVDSDDEGVRMIDISRSSAQRRPATSMSTMSRMSWVPNSATSSQSVPNGYISICDNKIEGGPVPIVDMTSDGSEHGGEEPIGVEGEGDARKREDGDEVSREAVGEESPGEDALQGDVGNEQDASERGEEEEGNDIESEVHEDEQEVYEDAEEEEEEVYEGDLDDTLFDEFLLHSALD